MDDFLYVGYTSQSSRANSEYLSFDLKRECSITSDHANQPTAYNFLQVDYTSIPMGQIINEILKVKVKSDHKR